MKSIILICAALTSVSAMAGDIVIRPQDRWNDRNRPDNLNSGYELNFDRLPLSGQLSDDKTPWSETYWPNNKGGISFRWNSPNPMNFKYKPPTLAIAKLMSRAELAQLSPAEKYDLFMGRYDYPTVKSVRDATGEHQDSWYGICHGWSPAALNHREPMPVTVVNPDGIAVPFGSSDVKALLSYYYAKVADTEGHQLGARCSFNIRAMPLMKGLPNCSDVNAGAFHIVLANQLGLLHEGFLADLDRSKEVWNYPIFAYTSKVIGQDKPRSSSADHCVKRLFIETEITYASDDTKSSWEPTLGTPNFATEKQSYRYWLELNAANEILGGEWWSYERPDFLWTKAKADFTGYFTGLNTIYRSK